MTQPTCSPCDCQGNWFGDHCNKCQLTELNPLYPDLVCNSTGTNFNKTQVECVACVCSPGYLGARCETPIIRGNVTFASSGPLPVYSEIEDVNGYHFVSPAGRAVLITDMALSLGLSSSEITIVNIIRSNTTNTHTTSSKFAIQQSTPITFTTVTYGASPGSLPSLDSLTNTWSAMQGQFGNLPISATEASSEVGTPQGASDARQPGDDTSVGCDPNDPLSNCDCAKTNTCPKKNSTSTGLIVGVVVGVVGGTALLLLLLVLALLWCRKNQRGLWKSKEEQDKDEMSSYVPQPTKTFNRSTASPEATIGTSSYLPTQAELEMSSAAGSATPNTNSVQSVNNHTPVDDPTLPSNIKAYKDAKAQIFYVDSNTMTTSWNHPNANTDASATVGSNGYGTGW